MSAIIVLRQSNRISMLTDGAAYGPDGTVLGFASKVWPLPHLSCALAVRGSQLALALLVGAISTMARDFDEVESCMPAALTWLTDECRDILSRSASGTAVEVVVAGWSRSGKASSFFAANHPHHAGVTPFAIMPCGDVAIMPGSAAIMSAVQPYLPKPYRHVDQLDPLTHGLVLLEAQRAAEETIPGRPDLPPLHIVGGFAQLTTIMPDRCESSIVGRWEADHAGAAIVSDTGLTATARGGNPALSDAR